MWPFTRKKQPGAPDKKSGFFSSDISGGAPSRRFSLDGYFQSPSGGAPASAPGRGGFGMDSAIGSYGMDSGGGNPNHDKDGRFGSGSGGGGGGGSSEKKEAAGGADPSDMSTWSDAQKKQFKADLAKHSTLGFGYMNKQQVRASLAKAGKVKAAK